MSRKLTLWSGMIAFVFLLASCASTAHIEKDDNIDFTRYNTFAWIDKDGEGPSDKNFTNDLVEKQIRAAVSRELEKSAGWTEVKNKPDVMLSYDVLVERNVEERNDPVYSEPYSRVVYNPYTRRYTTIHYPSRFIGYDRSEYMVREGTVTITMIDTKTDKTVWQGWTTDEVNSNRLTRKEIDNSVRAIFRKFDIAKN